MKRKKAGIAMAMAFMLAMPLAVNAGAYTDSNCKATVTITSTSGRAAINTTKVLQPTSKCTIRTSTGNTRTGTGTSYGTYSNITVYRYTDKETVTSAVGTFSYGGSSPKTFSVNN